MRGGWKDNPMKRAIALAVLLLMTAHVGAHAQGTLPAAVRPPGPFANVPLTDPAYHNIDVMQKAGINIGYRDTGTYSGSGKVTRYEFAVFITRLLPVFLYAPSDGKSDLKLSQAHDDLNAKLTQHPDAITAFNSLLDELQPYVDELLDGRAKNVAQKRETVTAAKTRLAALVSHVQSQPAAPIAAHDGPFPDVPPNHWAYQSVETLRKAGVMRGYPAGMATAK